VSQRARDAYDESHHLYYRLHRGPFERLFLSLLVAGSRLFR
jgi:hypothetical protein